MFANIGNLRLQKYILLHAPATQKHLCKLHLCVGQRMGRLMYVQQKRHCRQENISYILWIQIQNSSYTDTLIQSYLTWIRVGQIRADTHSHRIDLGVLFKKPWVSKLTDFYALTWLVFMMYMTGKVITKNVLFHIARMSKWILHINQCKSFFCRFTIPTRHIIYISNPLIWCVRVLLKFNVMPNITYKQISWKLC